MKLHAFPRAFCIPNYLGMVQQSAVPFSMQIRDFAVSVDLFPSLFTLQSYISNHRDKLSSGNCP